MRSPHMASKYLFLHIVYPSALDIDSLPAPRLAAGRSNRSHSSQSCLMLTAGGPFWSIRECVCHACIWWWPSGGAVLLSYKNDDDRRGQARSEEKKCSSMEVMQSPPGQSEGPKTTTTTLWAFCMPSTHSPLCFCLPRERKAVTSIQKTLQILSWHNQAYNISAQFGFFNCISSIEVSIGMQDFDPIFPENNLYSNTWIEKLCWTSKFDPLFVTVRDVLVRTISWVHED